mmetsp:Transcript_7825/g.22454  ORF Transcript_7825/g.22454 Transcript_7825/m.22454 type:complete len:228 (-) Transcript_7825:601-1284(-)
MSPMVSNVSRSEKSYSTVASSADASSRNPISVPSSWSICSARSVEIRRSSLGKCLIRKILYNTAHSKRESHGAGTRNTDCLLALYSPPFGTKLGSSQLQAAPCSSRSRNRCSQRRHVQPGSHLHVGLPPADKPSTKSATRSNVVPFCDSFISKVGRAQYPATSGPQSSSLLQRAPPETCKPHCAPSLKSCWRNEQSSQKKPSPQTHFPMSPSSPTQMPLPVPAELQS